MGEREFEHRKRPWGRKKRRTRQKKTGGGGNSSLGAFSFLPTVLERVPAFTCCGCLFWMYPRRHCWGSPEVEMTLENMAMAMGTNTASRSRNEIHCHTRKGKALCVYEYSVRRSANAAHQQRPNPATLLCQSVHQRTQWGLAVTCMLCAAHICLHLPLIFFASLVDAPSLSSQCLVASRPHPTRAGTGISCPSRMRSRTRDAGDPSRGLSELLHGSTAGKGQWR